MTGAGGPATTLLQSHGFLFSLFSFSFVLAIPYAPLCKDDCLGLCAQCGADRNVAPCGCEKPIDPRFVALQGLKLPS